ncbi:Zinc finger C2H2-type domain-containing protein [Paragonimus westermani]|uniref:Zinc finger C2H2-type domain-containing protein n=1 Tax=Paragonimus westermani TaxID=34504 RepID=A0A8T0DJG7_9TREM|nr:Zinc finger C2H2-type domain-containing protein [Paragonimus westermani]
MLGLSNPVSVVIPGPAVSTESLLIDCPACSFKASSTFQLRRHAILTHLSVDGEAYTRSNVARRFNCDFFLCAFCGASTSDREKIREHVITLHADVLCTPREKCAILAQKLRLSHGDDDVSDVSDPEDEPLSTSNFQSTLSPSSNLVDPFVPMDESDNGGGMQISGNWPASVGVGSVVAAPTTVSVSTVTSSTPNEKNPTISSQTIPVSDTTAKRCIPAVIRTDGPQAVPRSPMRGTGQDWSKLIARSDKKFVCLLCRLYIYSGRTEVVFHSVTRHLLAHEIGHNLSHYGRLTDAVKRQIGHNFAEGMRIRSGVHYKDAKRVEAALFRSIELHLRYRPVDPAAPNNKTNRIYSCSGCGATFHEVQVAYAHVNDELRAFLPEFMRARSCPWSLSTREEWVWCVLDLPIEPIPGKPIRPSSLPGSDDEVALVLGDRIHKPDLPQLSRTWAGTVTSSNSNVSSPSVTASDAAAAVEVVKSLVAAAGLLQTATLPSGDRLLVPIPRLSSSVKMETDVTPEVFSVRP